MHISKTGVHVLGDSEAMEGFEPLTVQTNATITGLLPGRKKPQACAEPPALRSTGGFSCRPAELSRLSPGGAELTLRSRQPIAIASAERPTWRATCFDLRPASAALTAQGGHEMKAAPRVTRSSRTSTGEQSGCRTREFAVDSSVVIDADQESVLAADGDLARAAYLQAVALYDSCVQYATTNPRIQRARTSIIASGRGT
jgi:hypothetical protein